MKPDESKEESKGKSRDEKPLDRFLAGKERKIDCKDQSIVGYYIVGYYIGGYYSGGYYSGDYHGGGYYNGGHDQ